MSSVVPFVATTAASASLIAFYKITNKSLLQLIEEGLYADLLKLGFGTAFSIYCFGKTCQECKKIIFKQLLCYRNWLYAPRSKLTKAWGLLLKCIVPKDPPLNSLQEYLPKHPLPKLEETCKKSLIVFKPLMNDEEYKKFESLIHQLMTIEGPPLQKILEKRYNEEENWITPLWDNFAYLAGRSSIAITSNFVCMGEGNKDYLPTNLKQNAFAAVLTHLVVQYKLDTENKRIDHMMIQNMIPICCDRYKYMLSTTRIPKHGMDELKTYPSSEHIVVFRKGRMYRVNVFANGEDGKKSLLTPLELQQQFDSISAQTQEDEACNPGVFTTLDRDAWAEIRLKLLDDEVNLKSLRTVESALFCIALTDKVSNDFSDDLWYSLCGSCNDRWYDKSLCLFVHKNCQFGLNVEHTTAEATISGRMVEYCVHQFLDYISQSGDSTHGGKTTHPKLPTAQLLSWNLDGYKEKIKKYQLDFSNLANDIDAQVFYTKEGKETIKKLRVSPDGFMQMALQLTFYRMHNKTPKTYETATTRLFKEGRTETIRPFSQHSVDFTKTMDDESVLKSVKRDHLRRAIKYQTKYKLDSMCGNGVDRHLFGLYAAGKMVGKVPQVFTMPALYESDQLSTSQSPLKYDPKYFKRNDLRPIGGGFGSQRNDGYGCTYFMDDYNSVHLLCTSYKSCGETDSLKFCKNVEQAMEDMKCLLQA